jgi:NitT/TauT family transport system substrate-binding protein
MTIWRKHVNRRQCVAAAGAGVLWAGLATRPSWAADTVTVRQGYQTNMWGMPTYYLLHSGLLQKYGIKAGEFAVPSGNLTMQQMVARQVDLGTFAGPSLALGYDKGGLIGIAVIEYVGKTARVMARKDLGLTSVDQLKGKTIADQTGSSISNIFVDQIAPKFGLHASDYTALRMNVNDMVAALAAKTVDAMVNVEPYNSIAEAQGIANSLVDFYDYDKLPVFMASTPAFLNDHRDTAVAYLKAWLDVAKDFKTQPDKVNDVIYEFYTSKGFSMSKSAFANAISRVQVDPGWPSDLDQYMTQHAQILITAGEISALPDWNKAFRKDLLKEAESAA